MIIKLGEAAGSLLSSLAAAGTEEPQAKVTLGCPLQPARAGSPGSLLSPSPGLSLLPLLPHHQLTHWTALHLSAQPPALSELHRAEPGPQNKKPGYRQECSASQLSQSRPPLKVPDGLSRLTTHPRHSRGTSHTPQWWGCHLCLVLSLVQGMSVSMAWL